MRRFRFHEALSEGDRGDVADLQLAVRRRKRAFHLDRATFDQPVRRGGYADEYRARRVLDYEEPVRADQPGLDRDRADDVDVRAD